MEQWLIANYDLSHKTAQEMADEFNNVLDKSEVDSVLIAIFIFFITLFLKYINVFNKTFK